MCRAVVTATRCPLMRRPARDCEQVDELLFGWPVDILCDADPGWPEVQSAYGYRGFAHADCLCVAQGHAAPFFSLPRQVISHAFCTVLAQPRVQSRPVAELTRGALVVPLHSTEEGGDWVQIALPNGETGYIKTVYLMGQISKDALPPNELRHSLTQTALSYLGSHYLWGGKSPLGIDCSGLAFMAYWLNGVTICRDARMDPAFPIHQIPTKDMAPGDLLYFPGHVAMCLGGGQIIHSSARSGGVVVESLDPVSPLYRDDLAGRLTAVGSLF